MARLTGSNFIGRALGATLILIAVSAALDPDWPVPASATERARRDRPAPRLESGAPRPVADPGPRTADAAGPRPVIRVAPCAEGSGWIVRWGEAGGDGPWTVRVFDGDYRPLFASGPLTAPVWHCPLERLSSASLGGRLWLRVQACGDRERGTRLVSWREALDASVAVSGSATPSRPR